MTNVAQCPDCNKKYKVPHLDKAWQCKACKVPLTLPNADSAESKPPAKKLVRTTCPACGAVVAGKSASCKECGERLGEDPYASPKHSGRPAHKRAAAGSRESIEQSAARGAAKKELRKLGFLRFLIKFGLFTSCLQVIQDVRVLVSAEDLLLPAVGLAFDVAIVWFLWSTHKALATIYGRPRPFVVVLAGLYTITALLHEQLVGQIVAGLFAAMYWMFVATLKKIQNIKDDNPEAFADPDQVRSIAADEKLHRRRLAQATRAAKERNRRLVIFGAIAGVLLLGVVGYKAMNKPPKPDETVRAFQVAWNEGDFGAVASLATPGRRGSWVKKLQRRDKKRGWDGNPPTLEKGIIEIASETSVRVVYPTRDGSLGARFSLLGKSWVLKSLSYVDLP